MNYDIDLVLDMYRAFPKADMFTRAGYTPSRPALTPAEIEALRECEASEARAQLVVRYGV